MHYTWGAIFNAPNGTKEWEFDKRFYTEPKHEEEVGASQGVARRRRWRWCVGVGDGVWFVVAVCACVSREAG